MLLFCSRICLIRSIDNTLFDIAAVLELRGNEKLCAPLKLLSLIIYAYQKQQNVNKTLSNIAINTGAAKVQQFAPFFAQNQLEKSFQTCFGLDKRLFLKNYIFVGKAEETREYSRKSGLKCA